MSGRTFGDPKGSGSDAKTRNAPSPPISKDEAKMYYHGLPSNPPLVARTGTAMWEAPTGAEAHYKSKVRLPGSKRSLQRYTTS